MPHIFPYVIDTKIKISFMYFSFIHNTILLVYHICSSRHENQNIANRSVKKKSKMVNALSLITMCSFVLTRMFGTIFHTFNAFKMFRYKNGISCNTFIKINVIIWFFTKLFFYQLLLERIFLLYTYKPLTVRILRIIAVFYIIVYNVVLLSVPSIRGVIKNDICFAVSENYYVGSFVANDFFISVFLTILFIRKLQSPSQESIIHKSINRFALLATIAIISSTVSLVLCALFDGYVIWISIDTILNQWCILLMYNTHQKLYTLLCFRMENCCFKICAFSRNSNNKNEIVEIPKERKNVKCVNHTETGMGIELKSVVSTKSDNVELELATTTSELDIYQEANKEFFAQHK
eukprot:164503_1